MQDDTTPTNGSSPLDTLTSLGDAAGNITMQNLIAFGVLIGAVALALVLHWGLFAALGRAVKRGEEKHAREEGEKDAGNGNGSLGRRIIQRAKGPARIAFMIIAVELTLPLIAMPEAVEVLIGRIISLFFIGVVGWLAILIVRALTEIRLSRYDLDAEDNLEARRISTRMRVLRQMATMLIVLITVAAMLMTFPAVRSVGVSMFASAGVAGIVVGFAARPVLSNLLAGIQIALTQPLRIGDAVIMEGEWGWIEEITSTYVVVKIWDWRRLVVPLTQVIEKPFQNWTRETSSIIGNVVWYLDYTAPVAKMREKLKEFLDESELWDGNVQVLQVIDTTQDTVQLRALMSAKNSPIAWDLRCEVREKMIAWLQAEHPGALPRTRGQLQIDQSEITIERADAPAPAQQDGGQNNMSDKIDYPEERDGGAEEAREEPQAQGAPGKPR